MIKFIALSFLASVSFANAQDLNLEYAVNYPLITVGSDVIIGTSDVSEFKTSGNCIIRVEGSNVSIDGSGVNGCRLSGVDR